ncbi:hypothetical protein H5410_015778 [Solanum commersonii]|uniref:Uncharacterized protein n=1 Tax=Solanum commersonii TaxID=4109 RepID=A0A9J5ZVE7_SOLCO|nr:hypothetical protein H5410_015778 [Solanum commersonii]
MAEIDNYQDSSAQSSDDVESSNGKSDSEDESSRDTQTDDEDEDPLSRKIYDDFKGTCFGHLRHIPEHFKLNGQMGEKFYYKVTKNKSITATTLMRLIKGSKLSKEQKLKCSLKQSEVFNERGNALYALYGFSWAFLVLIYEAFPHLEKYAKKSLDSPLPISHLLRWHIAKNENIILLKVVHPYLTPTVRDTKKNYLATLKPYVDVVKDTILDALKANLKNVEDEYLSNHNPNQPCENSVPSTSKDESLCEQSMVEIVAYVREEKLRRNEKNKKKKVDDDNFSAPTVDDEILPLAIIDDDLAIIDEYFAEENLEENDEEKEEEKLEEKKEEESEEKNMEEKKNEENEASGEEEEKITENEEEEKLEEEDLATDVAELEKEIDVMDIMMELNGEVGGDE